MLKSARVMLEYNPPHNVIETLLHYRNVGGAIDSSFGVIDRRVGCAFLK